MRIYMFKRKKKDDIIPSKAINKLDVIHSILAKWGCQSFISEVTQTL